MAALKKTRAVPRGSQMRISTTQQLLVPTAKPKRHTQTLPNRPGTSEGDGYVHAGRAPQGCEVFFLLCESEDEIIPFPTQIRILGLGLCVFNVHTQSCPHKPLDYTLSKFLCFMPTGRLTSCKPLETPADEIFPAAAVVVVAIVVVVVAFLLQYNPKPCFCGGDGSWLIDRSGRDLLLSQICVVTWSCFCCPPK